jgi:hypothetical protein
MTPGERIAAIKRIATRLGAEEDWSEIDLTLNQFGVATRNEWSGSRESYVRFAIKDEPDHKLDALDRVCTRIS